MKTIFDINDINITIKSYSPDIITIDKYSSRLRRLLLFLYSKKNKEVLYIVFVGSLFIKADFGWKNPCLSISYNEDKQEIILEDKNNDFKIISSGGIILLKGSPNEFENIFDNW
jgi:hypothetical protein